MKILTIIASLFLMNCLAMPVYEDGKPVYRPTSVCAEYTEVFLEVARGAAEEGNYDVLKISATGQGKIVTNEFEVEMRDHIQDPDNSKPGNVCGFTQNRDVTMAALDTIGEHARAAALAHEIGHAMGLPHSDHGLMMPELTLDCFDRAGACLVEALRDGGLLK